MRVRRRIQAFADMTQAAIGRVSQAECGWRGLLSLRDPAGGSHAAGPPDRTIYRQNRDRPRLMDAPIHVFSRSPIG